MYVLTREVHGQREFARRKQQDDPYDGPDGSWVWVSDQAEGNQFSDFGTAINALSVHSRPLSNRWGIQLGFLEPDGSLRIVE